MKREITDNIECVDEDGTVHIVLEITDYIETTIASDTRRTYTPGQKELITGNRDYVNYIDENTFEIVASGKILKRKK